MVPAERETVEKGDVDAPREERRVQIRIGDRIAQAALVVIDRATHLVGDLRHARDVAGQRGKLVEAWLRRRGTVEQGPVGGGQRRGRAAGLARGGAAGTVDTLVLGRLKLGKMPLNPPTSGKSALSLLTMVVNALETCKRGGARGQPRSKPRERTRQSTPKCEALLGV